MKTLSKPGGITVKESEGCKGKGTESLKVTDSSFQSEDLRMLLI